MSVAQLCSACFYFPCLHINPPPSSHYWQMGDRQINITGLGKGGWGVVQRVWSEWISMLVLITLISCCSSGCVDITSIHFSFWLQRQSLFLVKWKCTTKSSSSYHPGCGKLKKKMYLYFSAYRMVANKSWIQILDMI